MQPKTLNLLYWIFTILFAALMIFSAYSGVQPQPEAVKIFHDYMGFPIYFIQFFSVAKLLGAVAILIPNLNSRVKEWAYAGLFFDLAAAVYSGIAAAGKFDPIMLTLLIWIIPGILSYRFWHKKLGH